MKITKIIFNKFTLFAAIFAAIYQIFMIGIYLGGYKYTANHMHDATIVYINHDGKNGQKIIKQLTNNLNFKEKHVKTANEGKTILKDHKAVLVVEIPKSYTKQLSSGKTTKLNYYVNSAGDSMSNSIGTSISNKVTNKLNEEITSQKMQKMMVQLMLTENRDKISNTVESKLMENPQLATNPDYVKELQSNITKQYTKQFEQQAKTFTNVNSIKNNTIDINTKSTHMNHLMAPMMSSLAAFVGAMTASTLLFSSFQTEAKKKTKNKWTAFLALEISYGIVSITTAFASTIMLIIINHISGAIIFKMFGTTLLLTLVSFQVLTVTNLLFNQLAILINIPLILIQALTSGSIMSADLMHPIYQFIRVLLPVPSSYQLELNILYNTTTSFNPLMHLCIIGILSLFIELLLIWIKYRKNNKNSSNNMTELLGI